MLQAMSGHAKDVNVARNGCYALDHLVALSHPENQVCDDVPPFSPLASTFALQIASVLLANECCF